MPTTTAAELWTGRHYIQGAWQDASGATFENRNPARTSELLGEYPRGDRATVEAAVSAARKAFIPWRQTSRIRRGELFDRLARLIQDPVKGHFYWSTAIRMLRSLCDNHLGTTRGWEGVLKNGVYHIHKGLGVNESVQFGDYFFVEALEHALRSL